MIKEIINIQEILVSKTNIFIKLIFDMVIMMRVLGLGSTVLITLIKRPQLIVMLLVFQSFIVCMLLGVSRGIWYSYVLFLVFLGGILVVFIYIRSLASWVKVDNRYKDFIGLIVLIVVLGIGLSMVESKGILRGRGFNLLNEGSIVNLLSSGYIISLYFYIIRYLLLVLFIVCRIVKLIEGPLRKFSLLGS